MGSDEGNELMTLKFEHALKSTVSLGEGSAMQIRNQTVAVS